MILSNFTLTPDNIGVEFEGNYFDLHNNYEFMGYEKRDGDVRLHWRRTKGDWVSASLPISFELLIRGIKFWEVRGEPSDALDEIGYFPDDTLGKVDYNPNHQPSDGAALLLLRFVGGGEIALSAHSTDALSVAHD
jgi:hypothetical protein